MSEHTLGGGQGDRYARQSVLPMIGAGGQARLGRSRVVVIGCGALGSLEAELVVRAGVGRVVVVDRDILELHNLQRQVLFDERDVGERLPKAEAAVRHLRAINSEVVIEGRVSDVTAANVEGLVAEADLVLDGTDNLDTRYLVNDACVKAGRPWVYGGVIGAEGMVMAVRPGVSACLRCVYPEPPEPGTLPTCETQGVLNTQVAWVAALQVTEAMKILLDDPGAACRFHAMDIWAGAVRSFPILRREDCPCCGRRKFEFLEGGRGTSTTVFCGRHAVQVSPSESGGVDFETLRQRLEPAGRVTVNGLVLEFETDGKRLVVFPDGRVLAMGTTDPAEARAWVSRYIGI